MSEDLPSQPDWTVYVGESEGSPLVVKLDRRHGEGYFDPKRQWAVMVELGLPRVDGNGLPPEEDFAALEEVEAGLVAGLAADEQDWVYVVRTYGEGVCRFCFYSNRNGGAVVRVERTLEELGPHLAGFVERHQTKLIVDPKWQAYGQFFSSAGGAGGEAGGIAPSFRDDSPYDTGGNGPRRQSSTREEQPWRGEEEQAHPED